MQLRYRVSPFCAFAVLVAIGLAAPSFAQSKYVVTDLGTLGGTTNYPASINNSGQVAGYSTIAGGSLFSTGQFAYRTEPNQPINPNTDSLGLLLGGTYSTATGINNSGQVASYTYFSSTFTEEASIATPGQPLLGLGTFTAPLDSSLANGLNDLGQVVGASNVPNTCTGYSTFHAYVTAANGSVTAATDLGTLVPAPYTACGFSSALAVNNAGDVVGSSSVTYGSFVQHAFLSIPGSAMQDLGTIGGPSTANSFAYAINRSGQIVGQSYLAKEPSIYHAFLTTASGPMQDLGTLGGENSGANDINTSGAIVGNSLLSDNETLHGFIYSGGTMQDLNNLIPAGTPWVIENASAINDNGQIVGEGTYNGVSRGFRLDPVNMAFTNLLVELVSPNLGLNLAQQITTALHVAAALAEFELGHYSAAITQLNAFITEITSIENAGHLSAANATMLIDAAQAIIAAL